MKYSSHLDSLSLSHDIQKGTPKHSPSATLLGICYSRIIFPQPLSSYPRKTKQPPSLVVSITRIASQCRVILITVLVCEFSRRKHFKCSRPPSSLHANAHEYKSASAGGPSCATPFRHGEGGDDGRQTPQSPTTCLTCPRVLLRRLLLYSLIAELEDRVECVYTRRKNNSGGEQLVQCTRIFIGHQQSPAITPPRWVGR